MTKNLTGFTLVELVVVIVILGILAASAESKFLDLGSEARAKLISNLASDLRSSNNLVFAKAIIEGKTNLEDAYIDIATYDGSGDFSNRIVTDYGYAENTFQLAKIVRFDSTKVLRSSTAFYYSGYTASTCGITYSPASAAALMPSYVLVVSGC